MKCFNTLTVWRCGVSPNQLLKGEHIAAPFTNTTKKRVSVSHELRRGLRVRSMGQNYHINRYHQALGQQWEPSLSGTSSTSKTTITHPKKKPNKQTNPNPKSKGKYLAISEEMGVQMALFCCYKAKPQQQCHQQHTS